MTNNKTYLITGATSGIGKALAMRIAHTNSELVLVCRDAKKGESVKNEIIQKTLNNNVSLLSADFSHIDSIRQLARDYHENYSNLHVLINNAGVLYSSKNITQDGFEATFQINYLAPFLLTNLLLDVLKRSAPSRIINITSRHHMLGHIDPNHLQEDVGKYNGFDSYAKSKLALVLFTYELAEKLKDSKITVNCVNPGVVSTNIGNNSSGIMGLYFKLARHFMLKPEESVEPIYYLATSPEVENITSKYFLNQNSIPSAKLSYDKSLAKSLWDETVRLIGKNGSLS